MVWRKGIAAAIAVNQARTVLDSLAPFDESVPAAPVGC
jgi:hypothetical protein